MTLSEGLEQVGGAVAHLGTISTRRSYLYAFLIMAGACLWVGGVVRYSGLSLPQERDQTFFRFCGGECVCDGGSSDWRLMARLCPEGWQGAYRSARERVRKHRIEEMRQRSKSKEQQPAPNV